jgi:hypothetical protein
MKVVVSPLIFLFPFLVPILFTSTYFFFRAKRNLGWFDCVVGWFIFGVGAFAGEATSHGVWHQIYTQIGDRPAQYVGVTAALFSGFFLVPILWVVFWTIRARPQLG